MVDPGKRIREIVRLLGFSLSREARNDLIQIADLIPLRLPGKPERPGTYLAKTTIRASWFVVNVVEFEGDLIAWTERTRPTATTHIALADFLPGVKVVWFGPVRGLDG